MSGSAVLGRPAEAPGGERPAHRVGPNAVIQTRDALDEIAGVAVRRGILNAAGLRLWQISDPGGMVLAGDVNRLNAEIRRALPAGQARDVFRLAGERTADYILAHRIPAAAQIALRLLPARLSLPLLLKAVAAHSWTFAGSAKVGTQGGARAVRQGRAVLRIAANPLCHGGGAEGCEWHEAVFTRLFSALVSERVRVTETECAGRGDPACVFEISLR